MLNYGKRVLSKILTKIPNIQSKVQFSSREQPITMAVDVYGANYTNKPPLIIMHGLFGSKENWRSVCKNMETKLNRTIIAVDARNHGISPHTNQHSSSHMADDVAELLRSQNFPKASILGHSMGGLSMMFFALKYPHLVERCIIVDVSPTQVPMKSSYYGKILDTMKSTSLSSDLPISKGRLKARTHMENAIGNDDVIDFLLKNLKRKPSGEFYWTLNIDALKESINSMIAFSEQIKTLSPFHGPTMFLCGKKSNFMNPESWPDVQLIFPNSELHWLEAGHLVHFDQPVKFIELTANFLNY